MEKETKNKKKTTTASSKKKAATAGSKKTTGNAKKVTTVEKKTAKKSTGNKPSTKGANNKVVKPVEKKKEQVPEVVEPTAKLKKEEIKDFFDSEIGSLIKIVLIIVAVILIFLFITNIINNIKESNEELVTSNDIQYDEILVSNILNQKKDSYYVLVYDEEDFYYSAYNIYLNMYKEKDDALRVYTSVLNSGFNRTYYSEETSNVLVSNVSDLKFKGTTLVKVENGVIVSAYEEPAVIIEHLKSI